MMDDPVGQADEEHRTRAAVQGVGNPLHDRKYGVQHRLVIEVVVAVEADRLRIVRREEAESVHQAVVFAEQPVDQAGILGGPGEALPAHRPEVLQEGFRHQERGLAVGAGMVEFLPAEAVVLQQGVRQFEGRIHQDARDAVEQFRIHAPH